MRLAFVDLDDLWHPQQITDMLSPLKSAHPGFLATVYAIPNRLGPVHELKQQYPWLTFAIHGWEHTTGECLAWTEEEAEDKISMAMEMGYEPIFKAPGWLIDVDALEACRKLDVSIHHDRTAVGGIMTVLPRMRCYPGKREWKRDQKKHVNIHTHIVRNPITDWIYTNPMFNSFEHISGFLTPDDVFMRAPDKI